MVDRKIGMNFNNKNEPAPEGTTFQDGETSKPSRGARGRNQTGQEKMVEQMTHSIKDTITSSMKMLVDGLKDTAPPPSATVQKAEAMAQCLDVIHKIRVQIVNQDDAGSDEEDEEPAKKRRAILKMAYNAAFGVLAQQLSPNESWWSIFMTH